MGAIFGFFFRLFWWLRLCLYLASRQRLRARLGFEVDRPAGSEWGVWLYYAYWPPEWRGRLLDFCVAYARGEPLPMEDPLPLAPPGSDSSELAYRSVELARDTYLAQAAYALWLDMTDALPWKLEDWSDHELSYLLASSVCFSASREFPDHELRYIVHVGSRRTASENVLADPRVAHQFLSSEPEQGRCLVGASPAETCWKLSGWFHDYLWHNPGGFPSHAFHRDHPLLADRLQRHEVEGFGQLYVTAAGCGSASCLFADLMRVVNIPARKVVNVLESPEGEDQQHAGLVFDWQGGTGGRYLLHTDDLYTTGFFRDPAPAPKDTERGVALWDHVWLNPGMFGTRFSYESSEGIFGRATWQQLGRYREIGDWLVSSARQVGAARSSGYEWVMAHLQFQGLTEAEAQDCWNRVQESVLAYGEGDLALGYQRLLDGPESRHEQWCARTGKCF